MRSLRALNDTLFLVYPQRCMVCRTVLHDRDALINGLCNGCLRGLLRSTLKPPACSICGGPLISEADVCMYCRRQDFEFRTNHSLFVYDGMVRTLLKKYKFESNKQLAVVWASLIASYLRPLGRGKVVIPVPGRRGSVRKRGWDQMQLIADILQARYHIPCLKVLYRTGGQSQKELSYGERLKNLRDCIQVKDGRIPKEIILIDDVFTTGSTLNECARVCKNHGAADVSCVTIVRAF